jgi:hypothetical protein
MNLTENLNNYATPESSLASVSSSFIDYLKTLPENSGQLVDLKHSNGIIRCRFIWFYTDDKIDLIPINNITIITVHKRDFDNILPVF